MDDVFGRMLELSRKGYFCAQILMQLALDAEGKDCPELIRAMSGLNAGIGFSGGPCGALTGGACFLGYFSEGMEPQERDAMLKEFRDWFKERTAEYGGESCDSILAGDPTNQLRRCPPLIQEVYGKCAELLAERGLA